MFHQKGMAGFTLHPGKAYLEIKGKLYNPTPVPQTFLWWANPAVAVNEHYQSVFPPRCARRFRPREKRRVHIPIATGNYYKVDYSAGVDISNYKNIPVPTSYMAINSDFNFVGGYENDTNAGVLHMWPIIIFRLEKNNGLGEMAISEKPGTEILPMKTGRTSN